VSAGGVDEQFAVPFLEISGRRMCPVREFGEAIVCGDATTIGTEKAIGGFANEAVMFKFGVPSDDATSGLCAERLRGIATGSKDLAVVQVVVAKAAA
jgi:hypothetical protein